MTGGYCAAAVLMPNPLNFSIDYAQDIRRRIAHEVEDVADKWLAFTSIVVAPMRLAMNCSRSGSIVRSSIETA